MRRFLCCAVIVLTACALIVNLAAADSPPPTFEVHNALKFAGGNDAVHIREFDYTNREFDRPEEEDNSDFRFSITVLEQKWSDKQTPKNTKPTKKYGLLNASNPVEITVYGDRAVFPTLGWYGEGFEAARILDDKGKELFRTKVQDVSTKDFELRVSPIPSTYYVELESNTTLFSHTPTIGIGPFSVPLGKGVSASKSQYCYVMLKIGAGRERRVGTSAMPNVDVTEGAKNQILFWAMLKRYNISNPEDLEGKLTSEQISSTMREFANKDPEDYSIARSVAANYIKDHSIANIWDMNEKDYSAMADEYLRRIDSGNRTPVKKAPARKSRKK